MSKKQLPDYIGYSRRNGETGYACAKSGCKADHDGFYIREDLATCTPEERAVIEAAIRFRETSIALHAYFDSNEPDTEGLGVYPLAEASEAAGKSFKNACEALLTARAGKEAG